MDEVIEATLGQLSLDDQIRVRNGFYAISRTGFFKAFELAWNQRMISMLPSTAANADAVSAVSREIDSRGYSLNTASIFARLAVAPGEPVKAIGSKGINVL